MFPKLLYTEPKKEIDKTIGQEIVTDGVTYETVSQKAIRHYITKFAISIIKIGNKLLFEISFIINSNIFILWS